MVVFLLDVLDLLQPPFTSNIQNRFFVFNFIFFGHISPHILMYSVSPVCISSVESRQDREETVVSWTVDWLVVCMDALSLCVCVAAGKWNCCFRELVFTVQLFFCLSPAGCSATCCLIAICIRDNSRSREYSALLPLRFLYILFFFEQKLAYGGRKKKKKIAVECSLLCREKRLRYF